MPRPGMKMEKIREILRLSEKGISKREMKRALNVSRPVISGYIDLVRKNKLAYLLIQNLPDESLS